MKLILHAPNIHQGGGRTLLLALLQAIGDDPCTAILDERLALPESLSPGLVVVRVPATFTGRLGAEWKLRRLAGPGDSLLCLGNLPPLLPVRASVKLFVQNCYLLARRAMSAMSWRTRIRIYIERAWLRAFLRNAQVIVQTGSMAREVRKELGVAVRVMPFFPQCEGGKKASGAIQSFDFLYVASGEPHKNHRALVEAWKILAGEGIIPSLCLTLDPTLDHALLDWIEETAAAHGLRISNAGVIRPDEVDSLYTASGALIYPSLFESFGLPLIEATQAGLPVVASELDYVRDVVDPANTFDPSSPVSIARAVRRQIGRPEAPLQAMAPRDFLRLAMYS